ELISRACVPGILNAPFDRTGKNNLNLCERCTGGNKDLCRRDHQELYYGDAGAFRCMTEGGDIAFTRHTTVHMNTAGRHRFGEQRGETKKSTQCNKRLLSSPTVYKERPG
ncbi:hypothetical protein X801_06876, partial [Opisthorchis viverrini]